MQGVMLEVGGQGLVWGGSGVEERGNKVLKTIHATLCKSDGHDYE